MRFTDRGEVGEVRRTADGYLVASVRVARTGIQEYTGDEVGRPEMDRVRVYRPEEEVFARDAMHTYAHRPVTLGHPPRVVDAETWKEVSVGSTGEEVVRDGEFVRVPMLLMDADAIARVEAGDRELSMGYEATLEFGDGVTPDGEPYDAVQRNLRMNHLAIVAKARGGSQLRIGDDNGGGVMPEPKMRTIVVDGLSVETTDQGAQAIEKLQTQLADERKAAKDAAAQHDAALAKRDAEIDDLKGKILSDADIDARVQARADLIARAKAIAPALVTDGKSDAAIKREAVIAKLGDAAIAGKTEAYVDARFDILAEEKPADPFRDAAAAGFVHTGAMTDADKAYEEMKARLSGAWKQAGKEAH